MTAHPSDLRQQPGVCPECKGTRILYNDTRPVDCDVCEGTGQQPAQPLDVSWLPMGDPHPIELVKAGCDPVTGQPAQPGSGEVVRYPSTHAAIYMKDTVLASDFDRLQSALTEAQADAAFNKRGWDGAFLQAVENGVKANDLRDQLTAAQQREAELREALGKYGWHKPECDYMQEELPCTCGFMDAIKEPS